VRAATVLTSGRLQDSEFGPLLTVSLVFRIRSKESEE